MAPLRVGAVLAGIVLAAVLVFSLGVMTGKRITESAPDFPPAPAALPTAGIAPAPAAPATMPAPVPGENLTFYDRLSGAAPPPPTALPVGEAPPQAAGPGAAGTPSAASPAYATSTAAMPAVETTPPAPKLPPQTAKAGAEDTAARVRKLEGRGPYAVQVAAYTDRAAAAAAAARLKRQGFEVVTVTASSKGKTWHRLRVGSFPNREAAVKAAELLRTGLGMDASPVRE